MGKRGRVLSRRAEAEAVEAFSGVRWRFTSRWYGSSARPVSCLPEGGWQQRGVAAHGRSISAGQSGGCWIGVCLLFAAASSVRGRAAVFPLLSPALVEGLCHPRLEGCERRASLLALCGCLLGRAARQGHCDLIRHCEACGQGLASPLSLPDGVRAVV